MDESHRILVAGICSGLAMIVIGGQRILFPNLSIALRLSVAIFTVVLSGVAALLVSDSEIGAVCLIATPTLIGLLKLAAEPSLVAGLCRGLVSLRRPGVRSVAQLIGGVLLTVGGVGWFDFDFEADLANQELEMRKVAGPGRPPLHTAGHGKTDTGRTINFMTPDDEETGLYWPGSEQFFDKVIRTSLDSEGCNCFGWVFTGGRSWISATDVEWILEDNDYGPVSEPRAGDVAIYRDGKTITHAAIVRANDPAVGVLVEGKWGRRGVFIHQAGESAYGKLFTFYRSSRSGHILGEMTAEAERDNNK